MDPNAVHDSKREHDHESERTAIADEWQGHAGDGQDRYGHTDVLENVRENERTDSDHEEQTKLVAGKERDEKTREQEQSKRTDKKHSSDKSPLLADRGENVVVVHGGGGEKAEFDLRIRRFETFARPAARADGNEGLSDRPRRALLIDIGMKKRRDTFLLIRV